MRIHWGNKKGRIALHVVVWMIVFSLPLLLHYNYDNRLRHDPQSISFLKLFLFTGIFWVISFYLNAYFLTPAFIYLKKYGWYLLCLTGLFTLILLIHAQLFRLLITGLPFKYTNALMLNLPTFVLTIAVSLAYKVLEDKNRDDKMDQARQAENMKTELLFLRSQISPHFVFNILNNITAMARLKSDQLEPTVIKLSSLLRYMLYDTHEEKVSLLTEIEYLRSYIDLQEQRFGNKVPVTTSLEQKLSDEEIEPMLLIPFVENAFKHGVGMIREPQISISLSVSENTMHFSVRNSYDPQARETKDKTSGIGLSNVKRRLDLLYPGNHRLNIHADDHWYDVSLELKLH